MDKTAHKSISLEEYRAVARNMSIVSLEDLFDIAMHADTPPSFKLKFHELLLKSADFEPKQKEAISGANTGFQLVINLGDSKTISVGSEKVIEGEQLPAQNTTPLTLSIASLCEAAQYESELYAA